ncbi:hypothetical protein ACXR2U_10030 [Jatrophihabitans sp. YIM 134969]
MAPRPPKPPAVRALLPLGVARAVLLAVGSTVSIASAPRLADEVARVVSAVAGDVAVDGDALEAGLAVALGVLGVAMIAVYLVVVRAARRGGLAGSVLLALASGYFLVPILIGLAQRVVGTVDRNVPVLFAVPDWLRWLFAASATLDVAVLVVLVVPTTRRWRASVAAHRRWPPPPTSLGS